MEFLQAPKDRGAFSTVPLNLAPLNEERPGMGGEAACSDPTCLTALAIPRASPAAHSQALRVCLRFCPDRVANESRIFELRIPKPARLRNQHS